MTISVAIMAHPDRAIGADELLFKLSLYPFKSVEIVMDESNDEWHTGERSIRAGVAAGADFHVVIQDDALITPNFYDNIEGAIRNVPTKALISLYVGRVKPLASRVNSAIEKVTDETWLRHYMLLWGVGIVIPTDHIIAMLDFLDEDMYRTTQYDTRIGMFYQRNRLPIYYTMPSLVDHDDDAGSLLEGHQTAEPRVAHRLATGLVAWNDKLVDI